MLSEPLAPALNPLPPEDADLLTQLLDRSENLYTLAKETSRPLLELLAWTSRPDIAAYIAYHRALVNHLRVQFALSALADIVRSTDCPLERRRAAAAIIRAANPPPQRPGRSGPRDGSPPSNQPSPDKSDPSTNPFDDPNDDDLDEDLDDAPPSLPSLDTLYLNTPGSIHTPEGSPLPSPALTPTQVAAISLSALKDAGAPDSGPGFTTLYNFSAGIAADRTPKSLASFSAHIHSLLPEAFNHLSHSLGSLDVKDKWAYQSAHLTLRGGAQRPFLLILHFNCYGPLAGCWTLHDWKFANTG